MSLKKRLKKATKNIKQSVKVVGQKVATYGAPILPVVGAALGGPVGAALGTAGGAAAAKFAPASKEKKVMRNVLAVGGAATAVAGIGALTGVGGFGLTSGPLSGVLGLGGGAPSGPSIADGSGSSEGEVGEPIYSYDQLESMTNAQAPTIEQGLLGLSPEVISTGTRAIKSIRPYAKQALGIGDPSSTPGPTGGNDGRFGIPTGLGGDGGYEGIGGDLPRLGGGGDLLKSPLLWAAVGVFALLVVKP